MTKELPFGGDQTQYQKIAEPPDQGGLIFSRIETRQLNALHDQISLYRIWIKHAIVMLQNRSLQLSDEEGLSLYTWGERGKELFETYKKKKEEPTY